ncbi:hypothetical protein [Streptomyces sp. NPDC005322]|uniref:hypothetical protein n=1 Tax=unclassified Streptomyces TaxID=2593676 RepID=UPI0033AEE193
MPEEIRQMTGQQRLERILHEECIRVFAPFGATKACVCFSESPPDHLGHLIQTGRFSPWGIVTSRATLLKLCGGAVAYVPEAVYAEFRKAGLEHWAVRTGNGSAWIHEREWRLPSSEEGRRIGAPRAILVGDASWRPAPVVTEWRNGLNGERSPGPDGDPFTEPVEELPRLWRESEVWVWNAADEQLVKYPPGASC